METVLPQIKAYLASTDFSAVPVMAGRSFAVQPLAQGEYNLNFLLTPNPKDLPGAIPLVLRYNVGTQIDREDQVTYEYQALKLLAQSGVTPIPYVVDDSRQRLERGILIMEYLPGRPLDYHRDLSEAAPLFATIHQVEVAASANHLIRETAPLSLIYDECSKLLQTYFDAPKADIIIKSYLKEVLDWAGQARSMERYYQEDPWNCIVNTEVNSGNFIVNDERQTIHLIDWEMPRWGDPSQDISHFCSPLTTLWKTDFRFTDAGKRAFVTEYARHLNDRHLKDTLVERVRLRDPFVYMRGISWSAMGWVAYQTQYSGNRNADTWATLQRYMQIDFIRSLFDPFLENCGR